MLRELQGSRLAGTHTETLDMGFPVAVTHCSEDF